MQQIKEIMKKGEKNRECGACCKPEYIDTWPNNLSGEEEEESPVHIGDSPDTIKNNGSPQAEVVLMEESVTKQEHELCGTGPIIFPCPDFPTPESDAEERHREFESSFKRAVQASAIGELSAAHNPNDFYERVSVWQSTKEKRKAEQLEEQHRKTVSQCSFHPHLISRPLSQLRPDSPYDRLYEQGKEARERKENLIAKNEQHERETAMRWCTFKPSILPTRAKSRLGERQSKEALKAKNDAHNFSFHPTTNPVKESMRKTQEYVQLNPFVRLAEKRQAKPIVPQPTTCKAHNTSSLSGFLKRQEEYEAQKQERRARDEQNESTLKECQARFVNRKSEELCTRLGTFYERNEHAINKKEQPTNFKSAECTFKPRINREGEMAQKNKTVKEMAYVPVAERARKIEKMKEFIESRKLQQCTFKPSVRKARKYSKISSRVGIGCSVEEYINRMNSTMKTRDDLRIQRLRQREEQELTECTHKPKIYSIDLSPAHSQY